MMKSVTRYGFKNASMWIIIGSALLMLAAASLL